MRFEYYRLSLVARKDPTLFSVLPGGTVETREALLRRLLATDFQFRGRGDIIYQYTTLQPPRGSTVIVGRIGRQRSVLENEPPERDLQPVMREAWHASLIAIDPTHHDDGQKLAIEFKQEVGSTKTIAGWMANYLNDAGADSPYFVEVREIIDPSSFWDFVKENAGEVVSVEFEFVAPNMFGIRYDTNGMIN